MTKRSAPDAQEAAWVADEDRFVLSQSKKKACLRVKGGRASPLDQLTVVLCVIEPEPVSSEVFDDDADLGSTDLRAPEAVLEGLDEEALREVEKGIKGYETLERGRGGREFWETMRHICSDRRRRSRAGGGETGARGIGSVASDLDKLLAPKTLPELEKLEKQVKSKLSGDEEVDTDYWENLLSSLLTYKAKARLRQITEKVVEARLRRQREDDEAEGIEPLSEEALKKRVVDDTAKALKTGIIPALSSTQHRSIGTDSTALEPAAKRQRTPPSPTPANLPTPGAAQSAAQAAFDRDLIKTLAPNEDLLTTEVVLTTPHMSKWSGTHRPRKPRYFARVITGYEWNKYNQTHYDADNPPPKVVQGYKFNILYPDLVNAMKAPTYKIERDDGRRRGEMSAPAGEEDECTIRFIAGAPYEDIGFRVVDKEWDFSAKRERGFKSRFEGGVLQVWFQFKKIYYRK